MQALVCFSIHVQVACWITRCSRRACRCSRSCPRSAAGRFRWTCSCRAVGACPCGTLWSRTAAASAACATSSICDSNTVSTRWLWYSSLKSRHFLIEYLVRVLMRLEYFNHTYGYILDSYGYEFGSVLWLRAICKGATPSGFCLPDSADGRREAGDRLEELRSKWMRRPPRKRPPPDLLAKVCFCSSQITMHCMHVQFMCLVVIWNINHPISNTNIRVMLDVSMLEYIAVQIFTPKLSRILFNNLLDNINHAVHLVKVFWTSCSPPTRATCSLK